MNTGAAANLDSGTDSGGADSGAEGREGDESRSSPIPVSFVRVVEVGPRDGLQNEAVVLETDQKIRFVQTLAESGLSHIEVTSFVSRTRVPQLADAESVFARLERRPGVRYSALVPNERGLDRALAAGVDSIALFTAASDAFAIRNIGMTIAESLKAFRKITSVASGRRLWVRTYISTAFDCPFSGPVAPQSVLDVAADLLNQLYAPKENDLHISIDRRCNCIAVQANDEQIEAIKELIKRIDQPKSVEGSGVRVFPLANADGEEFVSELESRFSGSGAQFGYDAHSNAAVVRAKDKVLAQVEQFIKSRGDAGAESRSDR